MKKILIPAALLLIGNEIISLAALCFLVDMATWTLFKFAAEAGV